MTDNEKIALAHHLERIEEKVDNTFAEVGHLKREVQQIQSYDGPIGQMMQKMATTEQKIKSAHIRLDENDKHIDKIRGTMWSIVWKILLVGAAGGGTVLAAAELGSKIFGG
jgi:tetrahydromethanopterin S-methyltransferase subunit G